MAEPTPPPPSHAGTAADHPISYDPNARPPAAPVGTRGVGVARHLTSLMLAILAVPVAYSLLDYATTRGLVLNETTLESSFKSEVWIAMAVGAGCLFVAAAAGRISAFGPFAAALLWGVLPTLWVYGDFSSYADAVNDLPEGYDDMGFGLLTAGFAVYPAVAGLLLGVAIAGRWRRPDETY